MAKLIGYVFELESDPDRDDDKIRENFEAIDGVVGIDYCPSYWGSPCQWTITFEPPEKWKGLVDTSRRLDRAVKARKAKKNGISATFGKWVEGRQKQMHSEMMTRGGPFGNVSFVAEGRNL